MKKVPVLLSVCACALGILGTAAPASAQSVGYGSQSADAAAVQDSLRSLGYLKVGTTGYYGTLTTEAVRSFQRAYGLPADGEADSVTFSKLKQAAPNQSVSLGQLARIIHAEARGESFQGQVAVGAVVLNRVQSNSFPDSISGVIFQPGQFSAVRDGQYQLAPDSSAYEAARTALNGYDPTGGALFYYNPAIATSSWMKARPAKLTIGNHVFTN
ncbi:cell wall hydrolase [Paenibacillus aurantius]|uniref:Cell wall hydrolase n=1 Tax=Paenibacillus aurantius TaxID=2918900 RepID=A0AA96LHI6_9BACL|nr:cell wall hydrolase [Paenibacillus aurantius]WNQ13384.1 cell wall hydrolase [Paenibacillus aurantius]